ncbi:MAG: DUF3084 domain-containing protein [Candidatus Tyrphobacter sp.]
MTIVDIVRGAGNVVVILIIAGAVAYVGDRVGHQIGRRRLTLFGIRPRYTSTIIAVATGVIIALVVTVVAIFASQQVKTAFFRLSTLDSQIVTLQQREQQLEAKVTSGRLVLPPGQLLTPFRLVLRQAESPQRRQEQLKAYYLEAVRYINSNYPRYGLRPYVVPKDVDARLRGFLEDPALVAELAQSNVMVTAISDQNLFVNDQFHFSLNAIPDTRIFTSGQLVAQIVIPGNRGADISSALRELLTHVTINAESAHMPTYLATWVQPTELVPDIRQMQSMLNAAGVYTLTAYAAGDIYPHSGAVSIQIVLVPARAR